MYHKNKRNIFKRNLFFIYFIAFITSLAIIPVKAQQVKISDERIDVDWTNPEAASIRDEVLDVIQSNLKRYRYYEVWYGTYNETGTNSWETQVLFLTYRNPQQIHVRMVFNYCYVDYVFTNEQLNNRNGELFKVSPYSTGNSTHVYTRYVNEVLSRLALSMRGKKYRNSNYYQWDMYWIDALRFKD